LTLNINEIFQSLQGEGPAIGSPATFIRFSGCNLSCAYCDTDHQSGSEMEVSSLVRRIESGPKRVVITGGEPLLAGEELVPLVQAISRTGRAVDIETNGTIAPPNDLSTFIDHYVISPKLSNSGIAAGERRLADGLPPGPLKFALAGPDELDEAAEIADRLPGRDIYIMPLGTGLQEMIKAMALLRPGVESRGWRLLPRLHILLGIR